MRARTFSRLAAALALSLVAAARASAADPSAAVAELPPGERWIQHLREDLLPFWNLPDAWGTPRGSFPTYRCNDGRRYDLARPCDELRYAPGWMSEQGNRQYVRMMSRQAYFYGVAFHLTGDPAMLELARDGVEYLRAHALERDTGSAVTWLEDGKPGGPPVLERTSQDLAYALVGLAMYYDLTRDPAVLEDIARLKEHVFREYWDDRLGMLRWVVVDSHDTAEETRQELVAQLDQVNAYLLLMAPLLPEPQRAAWKQDLLRLARLMREKYFSPEQHMYWGTLGARDSKAPGARHNDFGHSAKGLWMTERIGRLTGDGELVRFATSEAVRLLGRARLRDGTWGSRPLPGFGVEEGKEWWIDAELDQLCATLALHDPACARDLVTSYAFWLRYMPDPEGHEVWGWVGADGTPDRVPKIHLWKSGYHSAEHALVAYLTTQALKGQPVVLYFAFRGSPGDYRPYLFGGKTERVEAVPGDRPIVRVTFTGLE
jgi:mannose/cellobiose epimerase-like protein (N-acyl-D-glucosamine 2-epimerase family)